MTTAIRVRALGVLVGSLAALTLLAEAMPSTPRSSTPVNLIVDAATWGAWLTAGYLGLGLVACAATALAGRRADRVLGVPRWTRRLVGLAVGTAVTVAAGSPAALADDPSPSGQHRVAQTAAPSLAWPGRIAPPAVVATRPRPVRQPVLAPVVAPPPTTTARSSRAEPVVVQAGDTLWSIAAAALPADASVAQVAACWPRWWAANRDVVGADPNLIHPGERLIPPTG